MKSKRIKHRGADARSGRFWRFGHEPHRRIRRQWRLYCPRPPQHFNCRCAWPRRIELTSHYSREVFQAMAEAGATVHAAFSAITKALSQVKIPPLPIGLGRGALPQPQPLRAFPGDHVITQAGVQIPGVLS